MDKYDFLINLEGIKQGLKGSKSPQISLITENIRSLLSVVVLMYEGRELRVDGFKLIGSDIIIELFEPAKEK